MYILGVNAYHADAAACLVRDGRLIAAIEEERVRRVKHWAGFPSESIRFCLGYAGIDLHDVGHIAISRDPAANLWRKIAFVATARPTLASLRNRLSNKRKVAGLSQRFAQAFDVNESAITARFHNVEHHRAHLASAFFVSPFDEAALLSVDGMGDFTSTMWGVGTGKRIEVLGAIHYPDSIGFFYTAITQYLGFWKFGDEYKVMGLSAFGKPRHVKEMKELVRMGPDGMFELNLRYFLHAKGEVTMAWDDGYPELGRLYSPALEQLLGRARSEGEPLTERHKDIAASAQAIYEEVFLGLLRRVHRETGCTNLCFAGGAAQNSLANGRIFSESPFRDAFIQPAGYDAGGALGGAYFVWNQLLGGERREVMTHAYWGPEYHLGEIEGILDHSGLPYRVLGEDELLMETATLLAAGKVVGWFQGRTEWGPRALGNRSILANPTRTDMRETLNLKIKKREPFRPFAPSILEEYTDAYFTQAHAVPFMEKVYEVKAEMRSIIPAVVHVDGTGRLQTVSRKENPIYWRLIDAFREITGVPVLLNTSFNENEPIVNHPREAIDCFERTKMDVLVLGNCIVTRNDAEMDRQTGADNLARQA